MGRIIQISRHHRERRNKICINLDFHLIHCIARRCQIFTLISFDIGDPNISTTCYMFLAIELQNIEMGQSSECIGLANIMTNLGSIAFDISGI